MSTQITDIDLKDAFSAVSGEQCNYCDDVITCDRKDMDKHLDDCQDYKMNKSASCPNCDGTGICVRCVRCGSAAGCVYCILEDGDVIIPGKDCVLCKGTGKVDGNN